MTAKSDAEVMHKAIAGVGTDEPVVIRVLTKNTQKYIQEIRTEYESLYHHDMVNDVSGETNFNCKALWKGLMQSPVEYRANSISGAVEGLGTNEDILIDILCQDSAEMLAAVKHFYSQKFGKSMIERINQDCHGDFRKLVDKMMDTAREVNVVAEKVEADADAIFKAGEGKFGTDEATFVNIMALRSRDHLAKVSAVYEKKHGHSLVRAIKKETGGHFCQALLGLLLSRSEYFADRIRTAIKGVGTNDPQLIRAVLLNNSDQRKEIAAEFQKQYHQTILEAIKGDTSGSYRDTLVALFTF